MTHKRGKECQTSKVAISFKTDLFKILWKCWGGIAKLWERRGRINSWRQSKNNEREGRCGQTDCLWLRHRYRRKHRRWAVQVTGLICLTKQYRLSIGLFRQQRMILSPLSAVGQMHLGWYYFESDRTEFKSQLCKLAVWSWVKYLTFPSLQLLIWKVG